MIFIRAFIEAVEAKGVITHGGNWMGEEVVT